MKHIYLFFIAVFIAVGSIQAQTAVQPAGSGTSADPYMLSTWEHLYWLQATDDEVPSPNQLARWTSSYRIINDIDLGAATVPVKDWNNGEGFRPIGTSTNPYRGNTFLGNGYTIKGLYINRETSLSSLANGFFGFVGLPITEQSNVVTFIRNFYVEGEVRGAAPHTGGLIGHLNYSAAIEDVAFYGTVESSTVGTANVGGLVGTNQGSINRSYANISIYAAGNNVGGLVGYHRQGIFDSYAIGYVSGNFNVGGFIGLNGENSSRQLTNLLRTNIQRSVAYTKVVFTGSGGGFLAANEFPFPNWFPNVMSVYFHSDLNAGTTFNGNAASTGLPLTESQLRDATNAWYVSGLGTAAWNTGGPDGTTTYPYLKALPPKQLPGLHSVRQLAGSAGWRLISSPAATTYAELLGGIWTQGGTGANATNGTSNVYTSTMSTSGALVPLMITDFTASIPAGSGMAVYVFNADQDGSRAGFPKNIRTLENPHSTDVTLTIDEPGAAGNPHFALAGNPFAASIRFDDLLRTNVSNKIWVYDAGADRFVSRANGAGDFNGLITPYTGFWIEHTANAGTPATLTFPAAARTVGGLSFGKEQSHYRVVLDAQDGTFSNSAWLVMQDGAREDLDAMDTAQMASLTGAGLQLYTLTEGTPLDINFIPAELLEPLQFPLVAHRNGATSLLVSAREIHLPDGYTAELVDVNDGTTLLLENGIEIRLDVPVIGEEPRYALRITPGSTTNTALASELPTQLTLEQNFPNPFNPSTTIRFALPESADVTLAVYDVTGRQLAVLVNSPMPAGSHEVRFDAGAFASGVYIYRLQAGQNTITRRMTLVK